MNSPFLKLRRAIRRAGGLRALIAKALKLIALQGWAGLISGVRRSKNFGQLQVCSSEVYSEWHSLHEPLLHCRSAKDQTGGALIKIILYPANQTVHSLKPTINSIEKQTHSNWKVIAICEDPSQALALSRIFTPHNKSRLETLIKPADLDPLQMLEDCAWITFNSGSTIYDTNVLRYVASCDNTTTPRLIYCDEDILDSQGRPSQPYFKPDWNPDLLRSYNYLGEAVFLHRTLALKIDGLENLIKEFAIYELLLQASSHCKTSEIKHIPKPLSHSTHRNRCGNTPSAATIDALHNHYQQLQISAEIEATPSGLRTRYPTPKPEPLTSILIPTKNKGNLLKQCIESIFSKTLYQNYELIIIDNGSDDEPTLHYLNTLASKPRVKIVKDNRKFNYSSLMNNGANHANGEILCMLNNDTEVISADWLNEMVGHVLRPEVGVVGAKLLYPDDTVQHGGVILGVGGCAGHAHRGFDRDDPGYFGRAQVASNFSAVTGACLVTTTEVFHSLGGFDEENLGISYNDIDYCLRVIEKGLQVVWTPFALLYHHESASRKSDEKRSEQTRAHQEKSYFLARWQHKIFYDPAYNINLTLEHENFSLAYPPRPYLS